jgi:hypothetical protein
MQKLIVLNEIILCQKLSEIQKSITPIIPNEQM